MSSLVANNPIVTLRYQVEGLELHKSLIDKIIYYKKAAAGQTEEALRLFDIYSITKQPTLIKSVKFHRDLASQYRAEAAKYEIAAMEVETKFGLTKSIRQQALRYGSRRPTGGTTIREKKHGLRRRARKIRATSKGKIYR